ncbi:carbamate kinase [Geothrix sp. 21YS21S-2]|uniref:carbamate kinase n=1 Tax=Geothrix sp. 21YS21S-2 TaxID=3068893 RepID=UPI0027B9792E|nr:carbamate kinase [Geothrix sp. 21YS21S-2]
MTRKIALIAIGGNALLQEKQLGVQEEQLENARQTAEMFGNVIKAGYALCVVHGNGPQVGNILIQQEEAANRIPPYTLDICDAMTQGSMGYMIERMLINRLGFLNLQVPVTTILTEVVVDKDDPGFQNPTKPVGPFYREHRAKELQAQKRWHMKEDSGRGWRKVVPSPKPVEIVQLEAVKLLLEAGHCVIAGGGGGIPVIRDASGYLVGVEAVIDKDRLSSLLAEKLKADTYVILTGVPKVALDFGKPTQRWVDRLTATEAAKHLADGQFPAGSMGPKIESALAFLASGGHEVLITSPEALEREDYAKVGTRIVRD